MPRLARYTDALSPATTERRPSGKGRGAGAKACSRGRRRASKLWHSIEQNLTRRGLEPEQSSKPMPSATEHALFCVHRVVISVAARFFCSASRDHLLRRPGTAPDDSSPVDDIVRFAGLLPVSDGWPQTWARRGFRERPFGCPEGRANFGTATTRAKMRDGTKFFRHVENAGLKLLRHVFNAL